MKKEKKNCYGKYTELKTFNTKRKNFFPTFSLTVTELYLNKIYDKFFKFNVIKKKKGIYMYT